MVLHASFLTCACFSRSSVLTPYYREEVLYSADELNRVNEDGISVLFYLQKIYPGNSGHLVPPLIQFFFFLGLTINYNKCSRFKLDEWNNFLERLSVRVDANGEEPMDDVCRWVSYRGQTLSRTGLNNKQWVQPFFSLVFWFCIYAFPLHFFQWEGWCIIGRL